MSDFVSEKDLARTVIAWLHRDGWDVWQEVDGVFDIIARMGTRLWSIETKLAFGAPVLAQARLRRGHVHWASVAVPAQSPKDYNTRAFLEHVAATEHVGILHVKPEGVTRHLAPTMMHRANAHELQRMIAKLDKTPRDAAEAGTNRGGYWTAFKGTSERIVDFVRRHPGCSIRDVIAGIEHHYSSDSSARACVGKLADSGVFKGVRVERDGKAIKLFAEERAQQ